MDCTYTPPVASILVAWSTVILDHAIARGLDPAPVLAELGVSPDRLTDRDGRIDGRTYAQLWQRMTEELADPDLGVHLSEGSVSAASFGVVGFLARASATLGEALAQGQRYQQLIKDGAGFDVRWAPTGATVVDVDASDRPRVFVDSKLCNTVVLARMWSGAPVSPVEVRVRRARPADASELERFFACPIHFDQPETSLVWSRETLALPVVTAEPEMVRYLETSAEARLATLGPRGLVDEVRTVVSAELEASTLSIERVARRMAVSTRSLQRQLSARGSSFRDVVDTTRHAHAVELLRTNVTLDEIAERLGFSDTRAFRRAFRRWTGQPPSRWARHSA